MTMTKCTICGQDTKGGFYGGPEYDGKFPLCRECYDNRPDEVNAYIADPATFVRLAKIDSRSPVEFA